MNHKCAQSRHKRRQRMLNRSISRGIPKMAVCTIIVFRTDSIYSLAQQDQALKGDAVCL